MAGAHTIQIGCLLLALCSVGWAAAKLYHEPLTKTHDSRLKADVGTTLLQHRQKIALENLAQRHQDSKSLAANLDGEKLSDDKSLLLPDHPALPFQLHTLNGVLEYPSSKLSNTPIIFHAFDNRSAFLECLWTSKDSLESLVTGSPNNTQFVFIPTSDTPLKDALWMKGQLEGTMEEMARQGKLGKDSISSLQSRLHYLVTSVYKLGNWVSILMQLWHQDCGLTQVVFQSSTSGKSEDFDQKSASVSSKTISAPIILKRLDARYDWLPSPEKKFGSKRIPVTASKDGCHHDASVAKKIAVVTADGCSFSKKVRTMEYSGAVAVIVYADAGKPVQDMDCKGIECYWPPNIPATMVPYNQELVNRLQTDKLYVSFQTTSSENFYFGINAEGLLEEFGWLLYPSFQFFNWQAQWFNYKTLLLQRLSREALVVSVINDTIMQGHEGVVVKIQLPSLEKMSKYNELELDASLSCAGTKDEDCPRWDYIVNLYLCCNGSSHLCNMELGRWITPFRRRIGRWLTDVSPLFPLFTSNNCTFTMKTVYWAKAWKPSLNLRFSVDSTAVFRPYSIFPLFRGGTFDKNYNKKYKPYYFTVPSDVKQVRVYAVITGHGSDNNGCAEFCVTSHHFVVNGHSNNITFSNAGTPLGCAMETPTGVEPNEAGTWLYGRDGWCDGRNVDPWVFNITSQITAGQNNITYFGWFHGKDPNPTRNPGHIDMNSFLVFYK